ncbi:MAG: type III-A CRISPR-associated RAMP protein Csm4 [Bryobacteraceae bacterium]
MQPAMLIRLRPLGPWRYGPGDGAQDRLDTTFRSDRLYSALTLAMRQLGFLEPWLDATTRSEAPALAWSSLFPFQAETLFAPPPASAWPPPPSLVTSPSPLFLTKLRWSAARFVPLSLIESILTGQKVLADQWLPDPESGCLLRRDRPSATPFRIALRSTAAVDRLTGVSSRASALACVEFESSSGLWTVIRFRNAAAESVWADRLSGAFRLLADTGMGARRTSGWGHAHMPEFQRGEWPALLMPKLARAIGTNRPGTDSGAVLYWLLSLYSPAAADTIDWSAGEYRLTVRGGRVENASPAAGQKKSLRMISEGSVVAARSEPIGSSLNVAPDGFSRPVRRSGIALALELPAVAPAPAEQAVEMPPEGFEPAPCEPPAESAPAPEEPAHEL